MTKRERTFYCVKGQMDFSEHLARLLKDEFGDNYQRVNIDPELERKWICLDCLSRSGNLYIEPREDKTCPKCGSASFVETTLYCPRCGVRIDNTDGSLVCSACHRSLNPFRVDLLERHPHKDHRGQWR